MCRRVATCRLSVVVRTHTADDSGSKRQRHPIGEVEPRATWQEWIPVPELEVPLHSRSQRRDAASRHHIHGMDIQAGYALAVRMNEGEQPIEGEGDTASPVAEWRLGLGGPIEEQARLVGHDSAGDKLEVVARQARAAYQ